MAGSVARYKPKQQRSIERVQLILRVTAELIREKGVGEVKTSEIAKRAEISLASLYRYFPNMQAIIRAMAEQHVTELQDRLQVLLEDFDLEDGADRIIDMYMDYYMSTPGYVEVWRLVQSTPELVEMDRQEVQQIAVALQQRMGDLYPSISEELLQIIISTLTRTASAVMQLALEEGAIERKEAVIAELKLMLNSYLRNRLALLKLDTHAPGARVQASH